MVMYIFDCFVKAFAMLDYVLFIHGSGCAICEISNTISGLVFANHANFIVMETNLLNSVSEGIFSIMLI